mmetsp:Transcript_76926/g.243089  ORF Transcript_76926/g.243089 Transcript_76926/m.243089 type:complete len:201 (+) Transcript_76926:30-632(+)
MGLQSGVELRHPGRGLCSYWGEAGASRVPDFGVAPQGVRCDPGRLPQPILGQASIGRQSPPTSGTKTLGDPALNAGRISSLSARKGISESVKTGRALDYQDHSKQLSSCKERNRQKGAERGAGRGEGFPCAPSQATPSQPCVSARSRGSRQEQQGERRREHRACACGTDLVGRVAGVLELGLVVGMDVARGGAPWVALVG